MPIGSSADRKLALLIEADAKKARDELSSFGKSLADVQEQARKGIELEKEGNAARAQAMASEKEMTTAKEDAATASQEATKKTDSHRSATQELTRSLGVASGGLKRVIGNLTKGDEATTALTGTLISAGQAFLQMGPAAGTAQLAVGALTMGFEVLNDVIERTNKQKIEIEIVDPGAELDATIRQVEEVGMLMRTQASEAEVLSFKRREFSRLYQENLESENFSMIKQNRLQLELYEIEQQQFDELRRQAEDAARAREAAHQARVEAEREALAILDRQLLMQDDLQIKYQEYWDLLKNVIKTEEVRGVILQKIDALSVQHREKQNQYEQERFITLQKMHDDIALTEMSTFDYKMMLIDREVERYREMGIQEAEIVRWKNAQIAELERQAQQERIQIWQDGATRVMEGVRAMFDAQRQARNEFESWNENIRNKKYQMEFEARRKALESNIAMMEAEGAESLAIEQARAEGIRRIRADLDAKTIEGAKNAARIREALEKEARWRSAQEGLRALGWEMAKRAIIFAIAQDWVKAVAAGAAAAAAGVAASVAGAGAAGAGAEAERMRREEERRLEDEELLRQSQGEAAGAAATGRETNRITNSNFYMTYHITIVFHGNIYGVDKADQHILDVVGAGVRMGRLDLSRASGKG